MTSLASAPTRNNSSIVAWKVGEIAVRPQTSNADAHIIFSLLLPTAIPNLQGKAQPELTGRVTRFV